MTVDTRSPSVFDLALPIIAYHDATDPDQAHRLIGQARQQSPIAMGPYGPELLTYDLVRTVLRDSRFAMPQASAWSSKASPPARSGTGSADC